MDNFSSSKKNNQDLDYWFHLIDDSIRLNYKSYYYDYIKNKFKSITITSRDQNIDIDLSIFILKFIPKDFSDLNAAKIIHKFLYQYRLIDVSIHKNYVNRLITNCIISSNINQTRGSLTNKLYFFKIDNLYSSITVKSDLIIKVSDMLKCFYLDSNQSCKAFIQPTYEHTYKDTNRIKVQMFAGVLNSFDLTVLLAVINQYRNQESIFNRFSLNIISIMSIVHSSYSRATRLKVLKSLKKMASTVIECEQKYRMANDNLTISSSNELYYNYTGNLFDIEYATNGSKILIELILSKPLIIMCQANCGYTLINWKSFSEIRDPKVRLIYYYLCNTIKPSKFYTQVNIEKFLSDLYIVKSSNAVILAKRRKYVRSLINRLLVLKKTLIPDFQINPLINKSGHMYAIKVRRLKVDFRKDKL